MTPRTGLRLRRLAACAAALALASPAWPAPLRGLPKRLTLMLEQGAIDGEVQRGEGYAAAHPQLVRVEEPVTVASSNADRDTGGRTACPTNC